MFPDETRPILLISSCLKYRADLAQAMKRFSHPDWRTIGIVGGAATTVYDISSGVLELAVPDSYELLPTKIQAAFSWIYNTFPSSPGVFKTDDDMVYDDLSQLSKAIQEKNNDDSQKITK
jgi:hypothetical protein